MDKYPRSGPLFDAVNDVYSRKNLYDETRTMSEVVQEAAKKYNVPIGQLKSALPVANQIFEGGPLSNPEPARAIIGGNKFPLSPENTKALGRAVEDDAARAIIGGDKFPLSPEDTKALGRAVEDDAVKAVTSSGRSRSMLDMLDAMTPDARNAVINRPDIVGNIEKEFSKISSIPKNKGRGLGAVGGVIGPAIAVAQGATVAQGIMDKMKAGESFKEAASNPELVKDAARGALGYMGANAGALAGSAVPGNIPAKIGTELVGAVGGGYLGSKLADLLTGNPIVDKIIRDRYEKARKERILKTKPTAASSVDLRSGD
jgi:hypothetical protein